MWTFPESDRVEMLPPEDAKRKLKEEQRPFVDRLMKLLKKNCGIVKVAKSLSFMHN